MKRLPSRHYVVAGVLAAVLLATTLVAVFMDRAKIGRSVPLSTALSQVEKGEATGAKVDDRRHIVVLTKANGDRVHAGYPAGFAGDLGNRLLAAGVRVETTATGGVPPVATACLVGLALLAAALVIGPRLRGRLRVGAFDRGRAESVAVPSTRFSDVAGADEAVEELRELVDFLHEPDRFATAGAKLPHGALLVGPPGTGKTLLARAVAGEAGVPVFAVSGSDFVETFVGVGASRIRTVFDRARQHGRAIIFIDEIDAVGKTRGQGAGSGSSDEREHTLNQLLVEMDGFATSGVIVLAATNRDDVLDPALTRPGRFDRTIHVGTPDRRGRTRILELHSQSRALDDDVDLVGLGRRTPGMSGADLAQLVNMAALSAARQGATALGAAHFDDALATTMLGRERRSMVVTERDRTITAWHEAGHAIAALLMPKADDPVQVTIVPRGPAGGVTWMSGNDNSFLTRTEAEAQLVVGMSGRAAEELLLDGDYSQGAAGDFASATQLAWRMVTEFGMSDLGVVRLTPELLAAGTLADRVHSEVDGICRTALAAARELMTAHGAFLEAVAAALLEEETLHREELDQLLAATG